MAPPSPTPLGRGLHYLGWRAGPWCLKTHFLPVCPSHLPEPKREAQLRPEGEGRGRPADGDIYIQLGGPSEARLLAWRLVSLVMLDLGKRGFVLRRGNTRVCIRGAFHQESRIFIVLTQGYIRGPPKHLEPHAQPAGDAYTALTGS